MSTRRAISILSIASSNSRRKPLIEHVNIHHSLKRRSGAKVVFDHDLCFAGYRMDQGLPCGRMRAKTTLAKGIPVAAQAVISDSLEAGRRCCFIGDLHSAAFQ